MKKKTIAAAAVAILTVFPLFSQPLMPWAQQSAPGFEERVDELVARMTLEEKVSQMQNYAPAIERLGIPAYNWWNECLHGVGRSGDRVTVFPQAIAMAATFDAEAVEITGKITSDEARAIYHQAIRDGLEGTQYKGLTFWTPNVNIFRDPRWGRGQETYGEDPYLTGLLGSAMVKGLQGDDLRYLKASACAKHYAVHSGPETGRHEFNVTVSNYELWDTYLPAFRDLVMDAGVTSVMCAYNRYDGQPCCGSDRLMIDILRRDWNFDGYVTSDCGAIDDFFKHHKTHPDEYTASADAVIHGTDLDCGEVYKALADAVRKGHITEEQIDISVKRLFMIRYRLGMFDDDKDVPFADIPYSILEAEPHKAHALKMARQSMVLLKNNGLLPLSPDVKKIAVIGPNTDNTDVLLGNYNGFPSHIVTVLEGIGEKTGAEIVYVKGSDYTSISPDDMKDIENALRGVDVAIFAGGISPRLEGEEGDAGGGGHEGFSGGDRTSIALPGAQTEAMKLIKKADVPFVFVSMSGSAIGMEWEAENADAIIQAWYGGQSAGTAVADVIFGDYNPSGRLPVTFYKSDEDLPDFLDYSMDGRTYRYFEGAAQYPFGHGLSYTTFEYGIPRTIGSIRTGADLGISVLITNTGDRAGEEVAQLYITHEDRIGKTPIRALKGVKRLSLDPGESGEVHFIVRAQDFAGVDVTGQRTIEPGNYRIFIGGGQPLSPLQLEDQSTMVRLVGAPVILDR